MRSNESTNAKGAAIKLFDQTKTYVGNCNFINNSAYTAGGALYVTGAKLTLVSSYFKGNYAKVGGAIAAAHDKEYTSLVAMTDCSFIDNEAQGRGPAVYVKGDDIFLDGGSNVGLSNAVSTNSGTRGSESDCNGIYHLDENKCDEFKPTLADPTSIVAPLPINVNNVEEDTVVDIPVEDDPTMARPEGNIKEVNDETRVNTDTEPVLIDVEQDGGGEMAPSPIEENSIEWITSAPKTTKRPTMPWPTKVPTVSPTTAMPTVTRSPTKSPTNKATRRPTLFWKAGAGLEQLGITIAPTKVENEADPVVPTRRPTLYWKAGASLEQQGDPPKPEAPSMPNKPVVARVHYSALEVPDDPPDGYYNFDADDKNYGPSAWDEVEEEETDEYEYWKEFEDFLGDIKLSKNYCNRENNEDRASPVELNRGVINAECNAYHEIRDRPGDYSLTDSDVDIEVLKDKLRIKWPLTSVAPNADIPKGLGRHYPVTHADFLIPSAHTLNGKQYAAEYQVWLMTDEGQGIPAISMLVDIDPEEKDNWYFQVAIDAWQKEYDENQERCTRRKRGLRTVHKTNSTTTLLAPAPPKDFDFDRHGLDEQEERSRHLQDMAWDPWHSTMMTSIWFWGYEGSTLIPPCYPFVEWRIIETPMTISTKQHEQLKKILFTNVDKKCRTTSIHGEGGVSTRPVVKNEGQDIHKCDCFDFLSDRTRVVNDNVRDCGDLTKNNAISPNFLDVDNPGI